MKTIKYLMITALALLMVACSSSDNDMMVKQPVANNGIHITAQLAPKSFASTRAVNDNGDGKITVTWAENEHIAILYDTNKKADATITAVNAGVATISFSVETGTADNTPCTIVYPYSAVKDDNSGVKGYAGLLSTQDGTLNANLDVRVGAGTIQTSTPSLTVTTQPAAQFAIFKFTLSDGSNAISATKFYVKDKSNTDITTVTPTSATSTLYVALPPAAQNTTYNFTATDGSKVYGKNITNSTKAIASGTYYQTSLTLWDGNFSSPPTGNLIVPDGLTLSGTLNIGNTSKQIIVADGATITLNGVTISSNTNSCIQCEGTATINLADGTTNTLTCKNSEKSALKAGGAGKTLTISGTGTLTVSSIDHAAGIGSGHNETCGDIIINGGIITATGGDDGGAGIGSGAYATCGNITINGGTITAKSSSGGSGIGGGQSSNCGIISISGGTINATGGTHGAGIGCSQGGSFSSISITGGVITARGGDHGAGIGSAESASCNNITITNGVTLLTAIGGYGANSIGNGVGGSCGTITIGGNNTGAISTSPYTYPDSQKEYTVYNSTNYNNFMPVSGAAANIYQKNEFIVHANALPSNGSIISKMRFYLKDKASSVWNGTFQVFLKEVGYTVANSFSGNSGATIVYEGTLDATGDYMDINFSQNYAYHGGNLLIGIYQTTPGSAAADAFFWGNQVSDFVCVYGSAANLGDIHSSQSKFGPKTTFYCYTPPTSH